MNASAEEAHEFLSSRGFSLRVRDEAGVFWADLTSHRSGRVVAERYGRGVDQTSAVVAAFNRYRLEQADWDTRGIELILQFTPARTASHSLRLHVKDAFEGVGLRILDGALRRRQRVAGAIEMGGAIPRRDSENHWRR